MTITLEWIDSQERVLLQQFTSSWSWPEWQDALTKLYTMVSRTSPGVVLICNFPIDFSIPPGGFSENMRHTLNCHADSQISAVIHVMKNMELRFLWEQAITRSADPAIQYCFVNTLDDALSLAETAV